MSSNREPAFTNFEEWYFKHWHKYHEKKYTIEALYYSVLKWASDKLQTNVLCGKKRKALDCGCAHGYVANLLQRLGYIAYGVDISQLYLSKYAKNLLDGSIVRSDVQKLPFRNEAFHLVTAFELLEHLQKPEWFLKEVVRILKPSGIFVATTPLGLKVLDMNYIFRSSLIGTIYFGNPNIEGHIYEFPSIKSLKNFVERTKEFSKVIVDIVWLTPTFLIGRKYIHVKVPTFIAPTLRLACKKHCLVSLIF